MIKEAAMSVRILFSAGVLSVLSLSQASHAMSAAQCAGLSKELNATRLEMETLQAELNAELPELEDLQIAKNDAVVVRRFSPAHEAEAVALEAEYTSREDSYNARVAELAAMNSDFGKKRQDFLTGCKAYLPKK